MQRRKQALAITTNQVSCPKFEIKPKSPVSYTAKGYSFKCEQIFMYPYGVTINFQIPSLFQTCSITIELNGNSSSLIYNNPHLATRLENSIRMTTYYWNRSEEDPEKDKEELEMHFKNLTIIVKMIETNRQDFFSFFIIDNQFKVKFRK